MGELAKAAIDEAIEGYVDPYLETNLVEAKCVKSVEVDGDRVRVTVQLGFPAGGYAETLSRALEGRIREVPGVGACEIEVGSKIATHVVQQGVETLDKVKNIIAVASGKGGVGKSTVSVNLALALAAEGATVGILDADIYGPSQPRMLGSSGQPDSTDGKTLEPLVSYHVQSMSIGYLVDEETPMIWRGPMVTQALEQLLKDTNWRDVDYLIVDLPPGTGDTQLTLAQKIPVSGAVIVTTPQDIALLDARKGIEMFRKVDIEVLGIVENMSTFICPECGTESHLFGHGGGAAIARECGVPLLGALPLAMEIREQADGGTPTVVAEPDGPIAAVYRQAARHMAARVWAAGRGAGIEITMTDD